MAVRRAGVITVDFVAQSGKLQADADQASGKLGKFGKAGQAAGRQIAGGMAEGAAGVRRLGSDAEKAGSSVARHTASLAHNAEAVAALAASHALAVAAMAKYTAGAAGSVGATDQLVNSYRLLRLVLSPTIFTAATLAVGVAVEETIRLVDARAKLIDQQSAFAAANRISFRAVDMLDATSHVAGTNPGTARSLYTGLQSQYATDQGGVQSALDKLGVSGSVGDPAILGRIAKGLHEVEDPAKQAQLAFELFGSQGGAALETLDVRFAKSAEAVQKWGLTLDQVSRTEIHQFRQDLLDFKESFFDFSDIEASIQKFKQNTEILAAATENMAKRGIAALNDFAQPIADVLNKLARIPEKTVPPPPMVPGATRGGPGGPTSQLADDLQAQEEARRRRASEETIEGQRQAAAEAERRSDEAMKKLRADAEAREADRTARQTNPNLPQNTGLLTGEQREALAAEAQSGALLAEVTKQNVRQMEASKAVTEILSERFGNLRIEMEKTALEISAVGKSEQEKRDIEAEGIIEQARVEVARRQISATTPPGQPVPAPNASQIANAIPADIAARLKQEVVAKLATDAEKEWRVEIDKTTESLERRIRVQEQETDAVGKTYKERQAAKIEGELQNEFGQEDYNNPAKQPDIDRVRELKTGQADAARVQEADTTNESLKRQIELEQSLAAVQAKGKDALDLVTLAYKLRALAANGLQAEIANEIALFNARKANADAAEDKRLADEETDSVKKLELEIEGTKALTAAQLQGAEAVRKQSLENKYTKMGDYDQEFDSVIAKQKTLDQVQNQLKITKEALATSQAYSDQIEKLTQELAVINTLEDKQGETRDLELDRARIEKEIAETLSKQALANGTLMDGLKAFFTEAGQQAEKPGQILHDGLEHAVDGVSDSLAKAMTGQKANWGKMLQGVGESMAQKSIKSMLDKGIGAIGQKTGLGLGDKEKKEADSIAKGNRLGELLKQTAGGARYDGQSASRAIFVQLVPQVNGDPIPVSMSGPSYSAASPNNFKTLSSQGSKQGVGSQIMGDVVKPASGALSGLLLKLFRPKPPGFQIGGGGASGADGGNIGGPSDLSIGPDGRPTLMRGGNFGSDEAEGPTGYPNDPVYVVNQGGGGSQGSTSALGSSMGGLAGGIIGAALGGSIGAAGAAAGAAGAGAATESVSSTIEFGAMAAMADGGPVSPNTAYWVGENGPEPFVPRTSGTIIPNHKIGGGDTHNHYWTVDARGADLGAGNRIKAQMEQMQQHAVQAASHVQSEISKRTPH